MPLYRRPDDLLALGEGAQTGRAGARHPLRPARRARAPRPYPDRAAIEGGWLAGRGLELAYLESAVDAFFVHVQGSARLVLPGGETMRVGYAAKNGHRFTAIGRILVQEGELPLEGADMDGIRRWLAAHPERAGALLHRNRSFIFFRRSRWSRAPADRRHGRRAHPLRLAGGGRGPPRLRHAVFVEAPSLAVAGAPFERLMIAQDTGSAIVGPARGDIFTGSGEAAGRVAGAIRHPARFVALLPAEARP